MDVHTKDAVALSKQSPAVKKAGQFLENMKAEFKKIQWTEDQSVQVYAKIVVVATFLLGMCIYLADIVIQKMLFVVDAVFRLLFG